VRRDLPCLLIRKKQWIIVILNNNTVKNIKPSAIFSQERLAFDLAAFLTLLVGRFSAFYDCLAVLGLFFPLAGLGYFPYNSL